MKRFPKALAVCKFIGFVLFLAAAIMVVGKSLQEDSWTKDNIKWVEQTVNVSQAKTYSAISTKLGSTGYEWVGTVKVFDKYVFVTENKYEDKFVTTDIVFLDAADSNSDVLRGALRESGLLPKTIVVFEVGVSRLSTYDLFIDGKNIWYILTDYTDKYVKDLKEIYDDVDYIVV